MIVAIVSRKGGVGKTTSAVSLAGAFALAGRRALVVDLDPQASASRSLGLERADLAPSIHDVLFRAVPATEAVRSTAQPRLDLLTASADLVHADLDLAPLRRREELHGGLHPVGVARAARLVGPRRRRRRRRLVLGEAAPHRACSHPVEAAPPHAQQEPTADGATRGVEGLRLLPGLHEHIMDRVLGGRLISQHVHPDSHERTCMAVVQSAEGAFVARRDPMDRVPVGLISLWVCGVVCHGYAPCVRSDHSS